MSSTSSLGSDRPDHPVFAACSTLDGKLPKKIPFRSAKTITVGALKDRISQTFSLSTSSFHIAYHDDEECEDCLIQTEDELTDAIWYFMSGTGEDDLLNLSHGIADSSHSRLTNGSLVTSSPSASNGPSNPASTARQKKYVTLQFRIILEYDGPSLSDTSSLAGSLPDLDPLDLGLEDEYESSAYTSSSSALQSSHSGLDGSGWSGYRSRRVRDEVIAEESESGFGPGSNGSQAGHGFDGSGMDSYSQGNSSELSLGLTPATNGRPKDLSIRTQIYTDTQKQAQPQIQTLIRPASWDPLFNLGRPGSRGPPSIGGSSITSSELGARWIEEQKARVARKIGSTTGSSRSSSRVGKEERAESGTDYEQGKGRLVLRVDGTGKCYYTYVSSDMASPTDSQHRASTSNHPGFMAQINGSTSTFDTGYTDRSGMTDEPFEEPSGPPSAAPNCSACGTMLGYMRYVCTICGPGKLQNGEEDGYEHEHEVGTVLGRPSVQRRRPSSAGESDGESSTSTRRASSVYRHPLDAGSNTTLSDVSGRSLEEVVSPLGPPGRSSNPFTSRLSENDEEPHDVLSSNGNRHKAFHGFELCPGCIEMHGIEHTRMMGIRAVRPGVSDTLNGLGGKQRQFGAMDHTYRELIWSATGWRDIKYLDDANCSICNAKTDQNRFKCATCPRFNLCRSCHQNVQEIHPTHAFLAVPDRIPKAPPPHSVLSVDTGDLSVSSTVHSGAFCHNCLGDIRGPRYHCTTCPAWDLCRHCQSSGIEPSEGGPHLPSHLMLEIPLPLPSHKLDQISERARDMWLHQDPKLLLRGDLSTHPKRSPSPDNETIYGGAVPPPRVANPGRKRPRRKDTLDHGLACQGCDNRIRGKRFQCLNCPSDPTGYNLCAECETRSHLLHDPMHVFAQLDRRVHFPLRFESPLLPVLYRRPVGQVRGLVESSDPTAYLEHVVHHSALCDIHVGPIQGPWLRCGHCASSFDICRACETVVEHDPTHVFIVLKSEVNMPLFRDLAALSDTHSRPLIQERVFSA